jgi:hypothetical protein
LRLSGCGFARQKAEADTFAEAAIGKLERSSHEPLDSAKDDRSGQKRMRPLKVDFRPLRKLFGAKPTQLLDRFLEALGLELL